MGMVVEGCGVGLKSVVGWIVMWGGLCVLVELKVLGWSFG